MEGTDVTKEPKPTRQSMGGDARAKALDPARRSQIASAAANARWSKPQSTGGDVIEAPTLPPPGTGKTMDGRCGDCGTVFVVAVLPMNLSAVAKLALKAHCPACGSKKLFVNLNPPKPKEGNPE
jgi:DNA-directed RNA polymerase subunit RPC12/RpoP